MSKMGHFKNSPKIIIADVQYLISSTLKMILQNEMQCHVGHIVENRSDIFTVLMSESISMLIIDFKQNDFVGINDLDRIKKEYPKLSILILTNSVCKSDLVELEKLGIKNIILKTAKKNELITAIQTTLEGDNFYSNEVLECLFESPKTEDLSIRIKKKLTCSEIEIVSLIANGYTSKEIAFKKFISYHTVMTHRKNILRKLNLSNSSELIMYSLKTGIIDTIEYYI